jgi:GNAT superfamily N-acetyltransferase
VTSRLAIRYARSPPVSNRELDALYRASWPRHGSAPDPFDFRPVLRRSLAYVCAYEGEELVGFVYLAWDGRQHAFLLDPTVLPRLRLRGIGRELVRRAVEHARKAGVEWVHVDYEPPLRRFYEACGFAPTQAGLIGFGRPRRRRSG